MAANRPKSSKRATKRAPQSAGAKAQPPAQAQAKKRVIGKEGEVRTPFADSAVTTRSSRSSAG